MSEFTEVPLPFDVPKSVRKHYAKCMDCHRIDVQGVIYHAPDCPSGGLDPERVTLQEVGQ